MFSSNVKVPKRFLQRSFSVCVKLIRGTYSIFSSVPSCPLNCLAVLEGTLFSFDYITYTAITRRSKASAWTCWCYEFADLYLHTLLPVNLTLSGRHWHKFTQTNSQHWGQWSPCEIHRYRWASSSFQLLLFLFWFSCIPVVFVNVCKDILVCCKRDQTSHTSTYYQEMAELVVVLSKITQFQIHTSRSSAINECFVIVVCFVSNRIAWEVLPVLDGFHGTDTPM